MSTASAGNMLTISLRNLFESPVVMFDARASSRGPASLPLLRRAQGSLAAAISEIISGGKSPIDISPYTYFGGCQWDLWRSVILFEQSNVLQRLDDINVSGRACNTKEKENVPTGCIATKTFTPDE